MYSNFNFLHRSDIPLSVDEPTIDLVLDHMSFCFGNQSSAILRANDYKAAREQTRVVSKELRSAPLSNACPRDLTDAPVDTVVSPRLVSVAPAPQVVALKRSLSPIGEPSTGLKTRLGCDEPLPAGPSTNASLAPNSRTCDPDSARLVAVQPNIPHLLPPLIAQIQPEQLSAPVTTSSITLCGLFKEATLPASCVLTASPAPASFKDARQCSALASSLTIESSLQHVNSHSIPLTKSRPVAPPATPTPAFTQESSSSVLDPQSALHTGPPPDASESTPASRSSSRLAAAPIPAFAISAPSTPVAEFVGPESLSSVPVPTIAPRAPSTPSPSSIAPVLTSNSPSPALTPTFPAPFQFAAPVAPVPRPPPQMAFPPKSEAELVSIQPPSDGDLRFLIKGRYYKSARAPIGRGGFSKVHI